MPDLSVILVVLNLGCALMCVMLAIVGAGVLATILAPLDPSSAESSKRHETYVDTQRRLAIVRARRLAILESIEDDIIRESGHEATRPVTIPRLPRRDPDETIKIHAAPVRASLCVVVGTIAPPPTSAPKVAPPPTLSDTVARVLSLAHMRRHVA